MCQSLFNEQLNFLFVKTKTLMFLDVYFHAKSSHQELIMQCLSWGAEKAQDIKLRCKLNSGKTSVQEEPHKQVEPQKQVRFYCAMIFLVEDILHPRINE